MDMLKDIRPADVIAYSFLISTLSELTFSFQLVQVASPISGEIILFGSISDRFRLEVGEYLITLIDSIQSSPPLDKPPKVVVFPNASSLPLMLDIIARRFVVDICEQPLLQRCGLLYDAAAVAYVDRVSSIINNKVISPPSPLESKQILQSKEEDFSSGKNRFLSSLGMMMTSYSSSSSSIPPPPTTTASIRMMSGGGITLRRFDRYTSSPSSYSVTDESFSPAAMRLFNNQWNTFPMLHIELQVLLKVIEVVGRCDQTAADAIVTPEVWFCLVTSLACLSSPWKDWEISNGYPINFTDSITNGGSSSLIQSTIGLMENLEDFISSKLRFMIVISITINITITNPLLLLLLLLLLSIIIIICY